MDSLEYHLKNSLGHLMGRTSRAIMSLLQKRFVEVGHDITVEQWLLLVNLRNRNGQFQQQLADSTYKDKTTVARIVDGLERKGLVERIQDTIDRRQKRIRLTPDAKKLLAKLKPLALEVQVQVLDDITVKELESCSRVLLKIYENANML